MNRMKQPASPLGERPAEAKPGRLRGPSVSQTSRLLFRSLPFAGRPDSSFHSCEAGIQMVCLSPAGRSRPTYGGRVGGATRLSPGGRGRPRRSRGRVRGQKKPTAPLSYCPLPYPVLPGKRPGASFRPVTNCISWVPERFGRWGKGKTFLQACLPPPSNRGFTSPAEPILIFLLFYPSPRSLLGG